MIALKDCKLILVIGTIAALGLIACTPEVPTHDLIQSDLNGVELQAKIWAHEEAGEIEEAQALKAKLKKILSEGNCNLSELPGSGGMSRPRFLECDHGVGAIFKPKPIPYPHEEPTAENEDLPDQFDFAPYTLTDANAELAAYAFDQLLNFQLVPMTVKRDLPGLGIGSLQYLIKGGSLGEGNLNSIGYKRMKILDLLIFNEDRWVHNWILLRALNRVVAIDHGRSFRDRPEGPANPIISVDTAIEYLQTEPELAARIQALSDKTIYRTLKKFLRKSQIQGVQDRVHEVQAGLK